MSMSNIPTLWPCCARERASPVDTVDFPTPPFPERTIILCLIFLPISCIDIFLFICAYACSICFCCCADGASASPVPSFGLCTLTGESLMHRPRECGY